MKKLLLLLAPLFLLTACSKYGKKVKEGSVEIYYKSDITKEQAKRTAELFDRAIRQADPTSTNRKSFQLSRPMDYVHLKMVVDKDKLNPADSSSFIAIQYLVSDSVFNGTPVLLFLTDDKFNAFKSFEWPGK